LTADLKVLVADVSAPRSAADRSRVFATVNGSPITSDDVEDSLLPLIFNVQQQVYSIRFNILGAKVNDILLFQEAQKRNVQADALLNTEVTQKTKKVSDDDAKKFYDDNKASLNGDFTAIKPQIVEYLEQQESDKAAAAYVQQLRKGANIQVFLPP